MQKYLARPMQEIATKSIADDKWTDDKWTNVQAQCQIWIDFARRPSVIDFAVNGDPLVLALQQVGKC